MIIRRALLADSGGIGEVQIDSYREAYGRFFPSEYFPATKVR